MAGFNTGVNALRMASKLIDMSGDNIANANTPGYHAKRASVVPVIGPNVGGVRIGLGAEVEDVQRIRNELVERALLEHLQSREMLGTSLESLKHIELLFSEPTQTSLSAGLGQFFDSVDLLSGNPDDPTLREEVLQRSQALGEGFNSLDNGLEEVRDDVWLDIFDVVRQINALTERIGNLNTRIRDSETAGVSAPSLKDMRDQRISELSELINVTTYQADYGVVNVSCAGTLLVHENQNAPISAVNTDEGVVIRREGATGHRMRVTGGKLAGLLDLLNEVIPDYRSSLDELANTFRRSINLVHTTALGLSGRFHSLAGLNAFPNSDPFCEQGYGVPAGTAETLVINVEDEATGEVTQHELTLDTTQAADAFLVGLRDAINASVGHVTADIDAGRINLTADDGYAFGFATPYDPNPAEPGDITAATPTSPQILDAYTGDEALTYEFNFLDGGTVGTDTIDIQVDVRSPAGPVLRTLTYQIDADYSPGDAIALENGLQFTLSDGGVVAGDGFSFTAHSSMDTAGVLDALGLNVLFNGLGAGNIEVPEEMRGNTARVAGAMRPMPGDNHRFLDMSAVRLAEVAADGTATLGGYYDTLVGRIGTTRNTREVQHENQEQLVKELQNRRDAISGVSVDEEMVRMIEARTVYSGALKYISLMNQALSDLLELT